MLNTILKNFLKKNNMAAVHRRLRRNRRYNVNLPRPRVFLDRTNPLETQSDEELYDRYRFSRGTIVYLVTNLQDVLSRRTKRNHALSPIIQILLFLRFLATGAFQMLVGDSLDISESAAGRACRCVGQAIVHRLKGKIRFPRNQEAERTMEGFRRIAGFPNVIGAVDGTFIKIKAPLHNEPDYINRKGVHSLNVQMTCDSMFRVTSVSANWPGSVHDARVWRSSGLCAQFERGDHKGLLVGDSGYPLSRFLMIPFLAPANERQERFNNSLCRTRVLIEQTFGIIKKRFSALHYGFKTSVDRAVTYIVAAVILHNIGIERHDVDINNIENCIDINQCIFHDLTNLDRYDGQAKRDRLVERFFSN